VRFGGNLSISFPLLSFLPYGRSPLGGVASSPSIPAAEAFAALLRAADFPSPSTCCSSTCFQGPRPCPASRVVPQIRPRPAVSLAGPSFRPHRGAGFADHEPRAAILFRHRPLLGLRKARLPKLQAGVVRVRHRDAPPAWWLDSSPPGRDGLVGAGPARRAGRAAPWPKSRAAGRKTRRARSYRGTTKRSRLGQGLSWRRRSTSALAKGTRPAARGAESLSRLFGARLRVPLTTIPLPYLGLVPRLACGAPRALEVFVRRPLPRGDRKPGAAE